MNDWVKLIIPLIAVAVWIVSNLANQQKEGRRPPRVPPAPPPPRRDPNDSLAAGTSAKPSEDNKYREELDRKRDKKVNAPKVPVRTPRARRPQAAPMPPRTPVVMRPGNLPSSPYARAEQNQRGPTEIDLIVDMPVVVPILSIGQVGEPAVPVVKPTPVAIKNMLELLKNPASLTTAFLLREVLDLPVSKRPRRRM